MNPGKNDTRAKWTRDKNLPGQKSHPGKMDPGIIARAKITRAEIARETVAAPSLTTLLILCHPLSFLDIPSQLNMQTTLI